MANGTPPAKIGLITLGQGPRPEYQRLHTTLFHSLGCKTSITMRHALDGLSSGQLDELEAAPEAPAIHCNVHSNIGMTSPLGDDWTARWIDRQKLVPRVQDCIDRLENEEDVETMILCVAEEFPAGSFRSRRPLVMPFQAMLGYAEMLALTKSDAIIGILVYGPRQLAQQRATWASRSWARNLRIEFAETAGDPLAAATRLRVAGPDLVMVWAYATGLAPRDPPGLLVNIAGVLGRPVLVPAIVTSLFVRNLLRPPLFDGNSAPR